MKAIIFCVVFCVCTSQALYTFIGKCLPNRDFVWKKDLDCRPLEFTYSKGDSFVMWINSFKRFVNSSVMTPIPATAVITMQPGTSHRQHIAANMTFTEMQYYLDQDTITIDVQVTTEKGCEQIRVVEGTEVSTLTKGANVTTSKYNDICIRGRPCVLQVEQSGSQGECKDIKLQTRPCTYSDYERATSSSAPADKDLDVNTPTAGADDTYFTIMIIALVSAAIAVFLLLIIAIRQRCWVRSNPPGMIHISPINKFQNRYYENEVFRTESDPVIEHLGQRVHNKPSEENEYEEIN